MSTPAVTETEIKKAQKEWDTFTKMTTYVAIAVAIVVASVVTLIAY